MKIAVCFFGIIRNIDVTINSIQNNIVKPCSDLGELTVFTHLFDQKHLVNLRSGENNIIDTSKSILLRSDFIRIEEPDTFLAGSHIGLAKSYGDAWGDGFQSLRNLYHQLYSLKYVTSQVVKQSYDAVIFVRPDLLYRDCFKLEVKKIIDHNSASAASIPNWQHWGLGYNDRFAICKGEAISDYGMRYDMIPSYIENHSAPLHAEKLLSYSMKLNCSSHIALNSIRANRVRSDGSVKKESFIHHRYYSLCYNALKLVGMRT